MTTAGTVTVDVNGKDVGLSALLTKLEGEMQRADQVGITLGNTLGGGLAGAAQRAVVPVAQLVNELRTAAAAAGADDEKFLQLAGALSQEAFAAGDATRATAILDAALGQQGGLAIETAAADRALAAAELEAGQAANQGAAFMRGMGQSLAGMIGPAAAAGAAIGLLRSAISTGEEGFKLQASLDASHKSIEILLRGVRDSGEVFAGAARFANTYKLTQEQTTEAIQASVRVLRTSKASVEDVLSVFAKLQVLKPEKTFSDAARALGDLNVGQLVSLEKMFDIPLVEAHKMKAEIDAGGDAVVVLNNYLTRTGVTMDAVKTQSEGAAGKLREMARAGEAFSLALSGGAGGPGLAILETRITATSGATRILTGDTEGMASSFQHAVAEGNSWVSVLGALTGNSIFASQGAQQLAQASLANERAAAAVIPAFAQMNAVISAGLAPIAANVQATAELSDFQNTATRSSTLLAQGLEFAAGSEQVAAVNAQIAAVGHDQLTQAAQTAANALLAAGAQGAASAAQLANSSSLIDRLTAAFYRLAAAKRDAGLADAIARGRSIDSSDTSDLQAERLARFSRAQTASRATTEAATQAELRHQEALKNYGPSIARAQAELAQLHKGTAEFADKETEIVRLSQAQQSATRRAGGAAKLSDQTKLNNSLLGDQLSADQKLESAEEDHQQKLLDIDADFARKSLEQQRSNEVSKRQSRADFYDKLTQDTKDIGPGIAAGLSAAYENAYAEAQKIAQAGNQKLADDYLKMKQRQISAEEDYQKKLAEARKNKDKDEAARLEAIHKLQQEANAEEEKQLLAGGDANVNARDAALTAEQKRFEEQQGNIGTAAENAAQRKIAAARLSGKAISDENTLLADQEATLNRIAGGGSATTASPRTQVPGTVTTPAGLPGAAAATVDLGALVGKLDAIVSAVNSAKDALVGSQRDTTSAVRGLGDRLMH